ncbi:hypothetical protein BDF22DRAFT_668295 [Syncephalis plumigaleata]|nr:hypothetical protein BDF22DRAFT_668295 [Syncephalis plumigaleata]
MPIDNREPILGQEYVNNATWFLGIPLYHSGEMEAVDYIMESPEDLARIRKRLMGFQMQVALIICMGFIFARNVYLSLSMVTTNSRQLSSWCCLISSMLGLGLALLTTQIVAPLGVSCRVLCWYIALGIGISLICCSAIILQKAYLVLCRARWVVVIGVMCMLPQAGYPFFVAAVLRFTLEDLEGCVAHYPISFPWYWFGSVAPINVLFSTVFSMVAYKQYRMFGSEAWKRLAQEGIQTMALVILCNLFCGMFIWFDIGKSYSEYFFLTDWTMTTTILVRHCYNMRKLINLSHRPQTDNLMNLSDINTAKTHILLSNED